MRESLMPKMDRRQAPRTKLAEIAYIGMGPENGGLVLDVSDGGLSFHAVAPVQMADTIHFLLSLRGHSRIEGAGEVVWTNEMGTVCGLRFTSLSGGAREHLNNWTNQSRLAAPSSERPLSLALPAPSQSEDTAVSDAPPWDVTLEPAFELPPADKIYLSEPMGKTMWGGQLFLWIVFGLLAVLLIAAAYLLGVHVGQSGLNPVARPEAAQVNTTEPPALVAETDPVAQPAVANEASSSENAAAPAPNASSPDAAAAPPAQSVPPPGSPVATSAPSGANPIPNAAATAPSGTFVNTSKSADAAANPVPSAGTAENPALTADQRAGQAAEAGKSELAAARSFLNGDNGQRNTSKAVQQLWAAIANGNSDAEIVLAELYATGDGVVKNCEQGRVLLIAAVKRGNAQAKVKLDEWKATSCQ